MNGAIELVCKGEDGAVFKLGAVLYAVKESDGGDGNVGVIGADANGDEIERVGLTDYKTKTIYILSDMCELAKRQTLAHELAHAAMDAYGFGQRECWDTEEVCEFAGAFAESIAVAVADVYGAI